MSLINKEKVLHGVGKAIDGANVAADHVDQFIKDNEIDQKVSSAMNKAEKAVDKGVKKVSEKIKNL